MKIKFKKLALLTACAMSLGTFAACGGASSESASSAPASSQAASSTAQSEVQPQPARIKLTTDAGEAVVELLENDAVTDFLTMLPISLDAQDYNATEKIAYLPRELALGSAPTSCDPDAGTFAYYAPWGNLSMFYRDFSQSEGLIPLGTVVSGIDILAGIEGNFSLDIELINEAVSGTSTSANAADVPENFVLIKGGTFEMGSPDSEAWRSDDETQHTVTVSDFYMDIYELTQAEYTQLMGENPSTFVGDNLPVENMTWYDAIAYCNARSEAEGLTPAYTVNGTAVSWDKSADGYRLPTEAEWEYACRAGTTTPFNTETSISADEANYYGHYPYEIEGNYFSQGNLETKPGIYRQTTVDVGSFAPNAFGLYDMHGNVSEWCWDIYGDYGADAQTDPTGAETGVLRVTRGGGWNDFAKNMRSAYRATTAADASSYNLGIRLVRGAVGEGEVVSDLEAAANSANTGSGSNILIAYFSWGGNTAGIAQEIASQTGADLFEIELVTPYSSNYNTVLDEAQRDQNAQARPELATHVANMDSYDTVIIGYPNWWASIPMPIASFLEEYDFAGKTIIPFCSHGGGRFGQSLTAIAKLAPDATMGEGLSVHYSGGSSLPSDVSAWLDENGIAH